MRTRGLDARASLARSSTQAGRMARNLAHHIGRTNGNCSGCRTRCTPPLGSPKILAVSGPNQRYYAWEANSQRMDHNAKVGIRPTNHK